MNKARFTLETPERTPHNPYATSKQNNPNHRTSKAQNAPTYETRANMKSRIQHERSQATNKPFTKKPFLIPGANITCIIMCRRNKRLTTMKTRTRIYLLYFVRYFFVVRYYFSGASVQNGDSKQRRL